MLRLRIAQVTEYYYPHLGGICEHVHFLAREARQRGHHVDIITSNIPGAVDTPGVIRLGQSVPVYSNGSMARITVEDCVTRVPNRFELVMLAAQRARDISAGAPLSLERDNDKNPVVALREIAEGTVELDHLRYELIHGLRRHVEIEEQPDDLMMAYQDQLIEPTPSLRPEEDLEFDLGSADQPTFDEAPEFE